MKSYYKINYLKLNYKKISSGDKSISHRILICILLKNTIIEAKNFLESSDILSTINLLKNLYIKIYGPINNYILISSLKKYKKKNKINFIGNSGTTIRISLSLILKDSFILGDYSLNKRTMYRIIKPLTLLGFIIQSKKNFFTPIIIYKKKYFGLKYNIINISSQVKSCIILSSINSYFKIFYFEKKKTRDHSERFLNLLKNKQNINFLIPNDFSTISFLIIYNIIKKKNIFLTINFNKLRIGLLDYLINNNLKIIFIYKKIINNDHIIKFFLINSFLKINICYSNYIDKMIDEIPILLILCINLKKIIKLYGLEELKFKESNRLNCMFNNIKSIGIKIIQKKNYLILKPGIFFSNILNTFNDHRLFMSFFFLNNKIKIKNVENTISSFSKFFLYFNNKQNFYYVNNK